MRNGFLLLAAAGLTAAAAGCGQSVTRDDDNLVAGKIAFVGKCGSCHTLARAGTKGTVGPNLDDAFRRATKEIHWFDHSFDRAAQIQRSDHE